MKATPIEDNHNFNYVDFQSNAQPSNVCEQQGIESIVPPTRTYPLSDNRQPPDDYNI